MKLRLPLYSRILVLFLLNVLVITAASVTATLPNPAGGTAGTIYRFGSDGTNGFTLATTGGTANFYGCTPVGAGATTLVVELNIDVTFQC